jgi:radical SAM superfamily enzyme YgiQ (UPF0313 family)
MENEKEKTYPKLTEEILKKAIAEAFFKIEEGEYEPIQMMTGHGGCRDTVKAFMTAWGLEHNWRNFRKMYTFLKNEGYIRIVKWEN